MYTRTIIYYMFLPYIDLKNFFNIMRLDEYYQTILNSFHPGSLELFALLPIIAGKYTYSL